MMEYNFNALLDEMVPQDMDPPKRRPREPPAFIIRPQCFSMGSVQGAIFKEEFRVEIDRAVVNLNFAEQSLFFRIPFDDAPFPCPILQAVSPIDDLQSVRLIRRGPHVATLTVTLRRPPRIEADFRWMQMQSRDWGFDVQLRSTGLRTASRRGILVTSDNPPWILGVYPNEDPEAQPDLISRNSRRLNPYVDSDTCNVDELLKDYAFDARYLVVGLVSQGLLLAIEVADLVHHLWPLPPSTRVAVLRALFRLERPAFVGAELHTQIRKLTRSMPTSRVREPSLPRDRVFMRRAIVTPTRVLLFPEVIETSNRVLRAWPAEMRAGRFIRVGFADEDGRLRITKRIGEAEDIDPDGGILARIRNVLHHGIHIAGRYYRFLAAGESQLKDHSCWMQMGDFSQEHVVAKYAARMGLCFSATRHVVDLVKDDLEDLDDIKHGDYKYTDGVGNCSQELAMSKIEFVLWWTRGRPRSCGNQLKA
ncbi:RNA dependent RNA polymerase-domain-containing protein [Mycena haematopus]|nr:RNA dependent RNA polymerase-domain-containing protein [Mycena haematopus]